MKLTSLVLALVSVSVFAGDPVGGCRVKSDVQAKYAAVVNNAGCVISRVHNGEVAFLMVYVDKIKDGRVDRGWGFPGGTPTNRKADLKVDTTKSIAARVAFEYGEPVPCTAGRETREETGIEVIVGDVLHTASKFVAFECFPTRELPEGEFHPEDTKEIKSPPKWISLDELRATPEMLRFRDNLDIAESFAKRHQH